MQSQGDHLLRASAGHGEAPDQGGRAGAGRGEGAEALSRRRSDHDVDGHLRHQRRRARRGQPARSITGGLLHDDHRPDDRTAAVFGQADPLPRRLDGVRYEQQGRPLRQGGQEAQDAGQHAAARDGLLDQRAVDGAVRGRGHRPGPQVHRDDDREGPRRHGLRGGAPRVLPEAPARRASQQGERQEPDGEHVLQPQALRPGPGRPLQARPSAETRGRPDQADARACGHRRAAARDDRDKQRRIGAGRYRPSRQPPRPSGRRADTEPGQGRTAADGAGSQGADDDPAGPGDDDSRRADQHQAGGGRSEGVLRRLPALPVHGPDESAGGADAQAQALGPRARGTVAGPRRIRRPGRAPLSLRAHLPYRDPGRPEHRPAGLARHLCAHQSVRLHRDALPEGVQDDLEQGSEHHQAHLHAGHRRQGRQEDHPRRHDGEQADDQAHRRPAEAGDRRQAVRLVRLGRHRIPGGRRRRAGPYRPVELGAQPSRGVRRRPGGDPHRRRGLDGAPEQGPLHGRLSHAARQRLDVADPVSGARRRQQGAHGVEYATPGGAAAPARASAGGNRHGGARGAGQRAGDPVRGGRYRDGVDRRTDRRAGRGGQQPRLPAAEVPAKQPGHLRQPALHRHQRRHGEAGRGAGRQLLDRPGSAGTGPERPGGLHELGGGTTSRTRSSSASAS